MDQQSASIFIGVVDGEEIVDETQCHWTDNKIGGSPLISPNCAAFPEETRCGNCNKSEAFIFQISCPVDSNPNDRVLYFFACVNPKCSEKDYTIYRLLTNAIASKQQPKVQNDNLFEDDWGISASNDVDADLAQATEQSLNLNGKVCVTEKCVYFKPYYISVFEEPNKELKLNKKEKENFEHLAKSCMSEEKESSGEGYEKEYSNAFKDDKTNYHFYKRLRRCPEQIIRYDWLGQPLHSTDSAEAIPGPCPNCGATRVFELQLMPALISILLRAKREHVTSVDLDFETILVYTCSNNCTPPGHTVQKEQLFVFKENYKVNNMSSSN